MKQAICHKCGKDLKHLVPDDATEVTCFACDNPRRKHSVLINVEFDEPCSRTQSLDTVHGWLETYGHTSSGHGFEFKFIRMSGRGEVKHEHKNVRPKV